MDTIKLFSKAKKWLDLYLGHIKSCLQITNNLSDVKDVQEARDNLELSGKNIINHKHDSRYLPLIQQETTDRKNSDDNVLKALATETASHEQAISNASNQIAKTQSSLNSSISNAEQTLLNAENNIQNNLFSLAQKISLNTNNMSTSGSAITEFDFARKWCYDGSEYPNYISTKKGIGSTNTALADLICELVRCSHTHSGHVVYNG